MAKYEIDPDFKASGKTAFTVIRAKYNGGKPKRVALHGQCTIEEPASAGGPIQKIEVPAPTPAELKILFEQGCKYIIKSEGGAGAEQPVLMDGKK